ncbi:CoA-transferase family III [Penicillium cf. griseofulvum]|nr:CoA-transferase family III [Penicillium cf. griseofulvum]
MLPLKGIKVIELAGLAPGPFAGLLLADYGASVLRIDRPNSISGDQLTRNKTSITLDLRDKTSLNILIRLLTTADKSSKTHNPRLIVARMTGFRRDGKYKDMAGHDINYLAVSGVLSMLGRANEKPYAPGNILGDFAGGGAVCFQGILLALISRSHTGRGQVVEANMVDGSAYLATFPRLARNTPAWAEPRGENLLDSGCPYYDTYETKDAGRYFAVGALEPQFYAAFKEKTRVEWEAVFDGTDACATPVLEQAELEEDGYEQRPMVHLVSTPAAPILADQGGWSGGGLLPGDGGVDTLREWVGWELGKDFEIRKDGALVAVNGKSKI